MRVRVRARIRVGDTVRVRVGVKVRVGVTWGSMLQFTSFCSAYTQDISASE